jgi:prophage regulatory protein
LIAEILALIERRSENCGTVQELLDGIDDLIVNDKGATGAGLCRDHLRAAVSSEQSVKQVHGRPRENGEYDRLLRLPEVINCVGLRKSAIYDKIQRKEFPKPVAIGKRARAWRASKIAQWIADRENS